MVKLNFRERHVPAEHVRSEFIRSDIAQLSALTLSSNLSFFCFVLISYAHFIPVDYLYSLLIAYYTRYLFLRYV